MIFTDKIIYIHMQKTGGTHIASLLLNYFNGYSSGKKHDWLTDYDTEKYIVGSIRNPWDWYVSLWASGIENRGGLYKRLTSSRVKKFKRYLRRGNLKSIGNVIKSPAQSWSSTYQDYKDPMSFRDWLKLVCSPDRKQELGEGYHESSISNFAGFMTYRYCCRYLKDWALNENKIKDINTLTQYDNCNNLLNFTIKTEFLESDLINALKLAGYQIDDTVIEQINNSSQKKINISKHEKVSYYYDDETMKLVEEKERFIIEKYGYSPPF